jgi:hypothetical protein
MKKINLVILKCIPEDKQALTISAVHHYITAEDIMSRHHDYADDDIERFQTEVDHCMREWVDLYGLMSISKYTYFRVVYGRVSESPPTESTIKIL